MCARARACVRELARSRETVCDKALPAYCGARAAVAAASKCVCVRVCACVSELARALAGEREREIERHTHMLNAHKHIHTCTYTGAGAAGACAYSCPNLRSLSLSHNQLTEKGFTFLARWLLAKGSLKQTNKTKLTLTKLKP